MAGAGNQPAGSALAADSSEHEVAEVPTAEPTADEHQGLAEMDRARDAFKRGDYAQAERFADSAVKLLPDDTAVHGSAATLFAQHKYRDAAAAVYAVLSRGPGWNEETLKSLYGSPEAYAKQLEELRSYAANNPKAADALFLLAYHQLTAGQLHAARRDLERVVQLEPKDHVAAELGSALPLRRHTRPRNRLRDRLTL